MNHIIFLLGVPRSGSTLLQRVLSSHEQIASAAEPWLLLPLLTSLDAKNNLSTYSHLSLQKAIKDLSAEYPELHSDYDEFVRNFVCHVYSQIRGEAQYFLDKTPRYYLIAKELRAIFHSSKFIYLIRNPVDVIESTLKTFCNDRIYRLPYYNYDLTDGLNFLCTSIQENADNQLLISYESFCKNPEKEVKRILSFLGLVYKSNVLTDFSDKEFKGSFGDPNRHQFSVITPHQSDRPLSFFRKRLYLSILSNISEQSLTVGGFERNNLIQQIKIRQSANLKTQLLDLFDFMLFNMIMFFGWVSIYKVLGNKRFSRNKFMS